MKKNLVLGLCFSLILAACGSQNPERQAPPAPEVQAVTQQGSLTNRLANPKVNILFVVDNSGSMKTYQEKMAANIELFSNLFFKNNRIDYKIGVVPVYDSKYLNDQTVYRSGKRKMNALGELVALKGLAPQDKQDQLFITRDTLNPKQVLKETVVLGTQWGPEAEESFSPVLAITDEKINSEKNQNFYDPEAFLAVIFLTDADDVTLGLSGEDFYQKLVQLKNGDRSKILIAAALPNLNNNGADCTKDGQGPVQSFPALLAASGAIYADLCSKNFGARLADFGKYLVQRVAATRIALAFKPNIDELSVTYGPVNSNEEDRVQIPRGATGYLFDSETNQVIISPDIQLERREGWILFVKAKPLDLNNPENKNLF